MPHQITCACALPGKMGKRENAFSLKCFISAFGTVYLTMLSSLIQLTCLNPGLINFGNIKMLFIIFSWNRKSELLLDISISISNCILEYKMRA